MGLPESVRKQAERAEELQKQVAAGGEVVVEPGKEPPTPVEKKPEEVKPLEKEPTKPPEEVKPPEPPAKPPEPPVKTPADLEAAEQRYRTLQAKYDKEVPELHARVRELMSLVEKGQETVGLLGDEIRGLREQLKEATTKKEPETPTPAEKIDPIKLFKEEQMAELKRLGMDEDLVRAIAQINDTLLNKRLQGFKPAGETASESDLTKRVERIEKTSLEERVNTFYRRLAELHSDWRDVNKEPEFLAWLNQVEPLSGQVRGELLQYHMKRLDADRVGTFFLQFKQLNPDKYPVAGLTDPGAKPGPVTPSLEEQVTPGASRGGGEPPEEAPAPVKVTYADYMDAVKKRSLKKITEEEYKKIETAYLEQRRAETAKTAA